MSRIREAVTILKDLGLPMAQQNERSALTLLALIDLKKNTPWIESRKRTIRIHDILVFMQEHYKRKYAENTRETIRRQTLHQFEQAGLIVMNSDDPKRSTNSPKTVYEISDGALKVIKQHDTHNWQFLVQKFVKEKGRLIEIYEKRKSNFFISVNLPTGVPLKFSPGKHNELQVKIIMEFQTRFCPGADFVYVGDTARKLLHKDESLLNKLGILITKHNKLPDIILYDTGKRYLFLIEVVTAHGPLSAKRKIELEKTFKHCKAKRIYISAFPNSREFKKHIDNIAWETEVWIEDKPDHMIHFDGEKFLSVYSK
jgi:hypothetical protein